MENETRLQQKADVRYRRKAMKRTLEKVPEPKSQIQTKILTNMLDEIGKEYRIASSHAAVKYHRIDTKEIRPSIRVLAKRVEKEMRLYQENNFLLEKQVKSPFKSKKWMVLRKTGVESKFVNTLHNESKLLFLYTI